MTRTRFAPSPTGRLHLGNARTALFNWLLARRDGGAHLLRIEDTDPARSREAYVQGILEDLRWLGLDWDEGPDVGGPHGPYRQSQRRERHQAHLQRLLESGRIYPCFCSAEELEAERARQRAAGRPPRYSGRCARLDPGEAERRVRAGVPHTLRFRVPAGREIAWDDLVRGPQRVPSRELGDFVVRRADGSVAFFFANAVDDADMAVTHVLRGEDHLSNTPRQLLLLEALDLPAPAYGHLPLITDSAGRPLSKRSGSPALADLRRRGYLPRAVLNLLARLGHHYGDDRLLDREVLAAAFDLARLGRAPARFDPAALDHWQRLAVEALDEAAWWAWVGEGVQAQVPADKRSAFYQALRPNCLFPDEAARWVQILFGEPPAPERPPEAGADFFCAAEAALTRHPGDYQAFINDLKAATGAKGKALFLPLRLALTGRADGPELARIIELLGPEVARRRLTAHCHGN